MKKHILIACLLLLSLCGYAQQTTVTGKVISATDNEPMIGATVLIKGTSNGGITDIDGNYTLRNVPADAVITYSMIGFKTQEESLNGRTVINITLEEDVALLDEVVVIGYGVAKKSDLTSSISSVKGEDLQSMTVGNVTTALQGKVAGVQVISPGNPGGMPKVLIRGFSTMNLSTDPLYVVDGVPMGTNANFINQNEIESMEVLKDASASAIYGSQASNGVIMITTKRGKVGKPVFNVDLTYGMQVTQRPYDVANTQQYVDIVNTAVRNSGIPQRFDPDEYANAPTTDWWKAAMRSTAPQYNASLSVQGGSEMYTYSVSLNAYDQRDFYKDGGNGGWGKYTARITNDFKFNKYVSAGIMLNPRHEKWGSSENWADNMKLDPITPVYLPESELTGNENEYSVYGRSNLSMVWNSVASNKRNFKKNGYYALGGNAYVNINPIPELTLRSMIGWDYKSEYENNFEPDYIIDAAHEHNEINKVTRKKDTYSSYSWQSTASYLKSFGLHNVNGMIGFTMDRYIENKLEASKEGVPNNTDILQELEAATVNPFANGSSKTTSLMSYFGRISYNYDRKYYLTATYRRDGSSKFMDKNKWASFPSVSLAWQTVNESFMQNQRVFDSLKLRLGWGQVGNQNIPTSVYESLIYQQQYISGSNLINTTHVQSLRNTDIKWETVEDFNIGVDFSTLGGSLSGSVEYYVKNTRDMLFKKPYPYYSGYPDWGNIFANVGSMRTRGFEFLINYRNNIGKFKYDVSLTFTTFDAKATELADGAKIVYGMDGRTRTEEGMAPGYFYGYVADGIFQNQTEINSHTSEKGDLLQPSARPGDMRFKDINKDGVLNGDDRTKIGSPWADFSSGLNINLAYGNFDFLVNLYGTYGNDLVNQEVKTSLYSAHGNFHNYADDAASKAWHGEGTSNKYPILSNNDNNENWSKFSSFFVEDGSFLRLKNLQIGYTLPDEISRKINLTKCRFYVSGQNLLTWTNFNGVDPEVSGETTLGFGFTEWKNYPTLKTFLVGVNVTF